MKIERGVVYNPTIHHGYLLEKNRHPGHRRPWPLSPPLGCPCPICLRAHVDKAMGNAPYRRRHENLAGVDVLPNNPPWQFFTKLFVILGADRAMREDLYRQCHANQAEVYAVSYLFKLISHLF